MRATSGGRSDLSRSQSLRSVCVTVCLHWRVVKERLCLFLLWFTGIFSSGGTYHATVGRGPISTCALASQVPHRVWYLSPASHRPPACICMPRHEPPNAARARSRDLPQLYPRTRSRSTRHTFTLGPACRCSLPLSKPRTGPGLGALLRNQRGCSRHPCSDPPVASGSSTRNLGAWRSRSLRSSVLMTARCCGTAVGCGGWETGFGVVR